ncbi:phosphoribosyl-ATP pyrophosphatase [Rhizobiales bacterium GAS191]|nr:phosphoribosyl-ATP pyrophosphatase [Rhizobiales bacterium GAS113]SEB81425.1 phosphoribosyl-ATP pyrophosphatase [Rhizobiales bacterium GAS188]SED46113.1 phosphoribosyl-ATP pyrophosphatase [Rhizobiales bacterium GAS191]
MSAFNRHDHVASSIPLCGADELRLLRLASANDTTPVPSAVAQRAETDEITRLYKALDLVRPDTNPRTAQLLDGSRRKMGQKLIEEASEVAFEGLRNRSRGVIRESADLIYHLVVLWRECGVTPDEVWDAMRERADMLGIAEKLPKRPKSQE